MSKLRINLCFCFLFKLGSLGAQIVSFASPDAKSTILISKSDKLGSDWKQEGFNDYLSICLKQDTDSLTWTGIYYQDESGSPAEVIWSKSSESALFLHRPQRGEVTMGVFRPNGKIKYEPLLTDDQIKNWNLGVNANLTDLKKMWIENWAEVDRDVYEGDLVIAATLTRRLHLRISAGEIASDVTVLTQQDHE